MLGCQAASLVVELVEVERGGIGVIGRIVVADSAAGVVDLVEQGRAVVSNEMGPADEAGVTVEEGECCREGGRRSRCGGSGVEEVGG